MAQQMSLEEMVRMIEDVQGGTMQFTLWNSTDSGEHNFEILLLDCLGAPNGRMDMVLTEREYRWMRLRMTLDEEYRLDDLPVYTVRMLCDKSAGFREWFARERMP